MDALAQLALLLMLWSAAPVGGDAPHQARPVRFEPTTAQASALRVREARARLAEEVKDLFIAAQMDYPPAQVLLRVFKREGELELWARPVKSDRFTLVKAYPICASSGDLGPKRRRGDLQVPEGFYEVDAFNPASSFHLALRVSYPNASDRARAAAADPGDDICIHGDCVTIGCVPLTDPVIEVVYLVSLDSTTRHGLPVLVHMFPGRLDDAGMAWLKEHYPERPDLSAFWEELRPGYTRFERDHVPARFEVAKGGAYRFQERR